MDTVPGLKVEDVVVVSRANDGHVTLRGGGEWEWPEELQIFATPDDVPRWRERRREVLDRLVAELPEALGITPELVWRPTAQAGWEGVMRLEYGVTPSVLGWGERWLTITCPPTLRYTYEFNTDAELQHHVAFWSQVRIDKGWIDPEHLEALPPSPPRRLEGVSAPQGAKLLVLWFRDDDLAQERPVSSEFVTAQVRARPGFTYQSFFV